MTSGSRLFLLMFRYLSKVRYSQSSAIIVRHRHDDDDDDDDHDHRYHDYVTPSQISLKSFETPGNSGVNLSAVIPVRLLSKHSFTLPALGY
jgi:hypothetical protein